jgi:hypothetical protein
MVDNKPVGGVKILECTPKMKDDILDIILDPQFSDLGEWRMLDYDNGFNIGIKKTQGKTFIEYTSSIKVKSVKVPAPDEVPDLYSMVSNRVADDEEFMLTYLDYVGLSESGSTIANEI